MKKKYLNNSGFTLIELLISIAIFTILSSIVLINFRANEKVHNLKNQAMLVLDSIRSAQTSALSGRLINQELPVSYGFILSSSVGVTFSDETEDCKNGCLYASTTNGWKFLAKSGLADQMKIESYDKNNALNSDTVIDFMPPRANMNISFNSASSQSDVFLKIYDSANPDIGLYCLGVSRMSGRMDFEDRSGGDTFCPSKN